MKTVRVVAAVIREGNEVFATERGYGDYKGQWEFPGGKIEEGEGTKEALIREIMEELDVMIGVDEKIMTVEYDYPSFHLSMECFFAHIIEGVPVLKEANDAAYFDKTSLSSVTWQPADVLLVEKLKAIL